MKIKKSFNRTNAKTGVVRIRRDSYSTVNGYTKVNSWWDIRAKVWKRDMGQCVDHKRRGVIVPAKDVHHIIAISKGGTTTMGNLISLCAACHIRRHPQNRELKKYHDKRSIK